GADTNENAALVVWASVWDSETDAKQIAAGLPRRAGVEIHTVQTGDRCVYAIGRNVKKTALEEIAKIVLRDFKTTNPPALKVAR
ncbi:MAG: hypothetical protein ACKVS6_00110, partial [Planctomycetota bacterium]